MPYIKERGSTGPIPSVPFNQPKNLFRYGEQSLWSTQFFTANVAIANGTNRLFTTPLGQVGQGFTNSLSIGETNIKEGGRIPSGIAYDVFGVSCSMASASAAGDTGTLGSAIDTQGKIDNLLNLESNGVLSWDFTQTQVDIAPIVLIGSGGGAFGAVASDDSGAAGVVNSGHLNNGAGSVWLYRKHPVALPGNSTFSILLRFGSRADLPATGDDGFAVRVTLLGYYKNVIEIG